MSNIKPKPREPKEKVKCPYCSEVSRRNGYFFQFNDDGTTNEVLRFFCSRGCRKTFSQSTRVIRRGEYKRNGIYSFSKSFNKRRMEKSGVIWKRIETYIKENGFQSIDRIEKDLSISRKTYYKYLKNLSFFSLRDFERKRDSIPLQNTLLLNWEKIHSRTKEKIRFVFLIDLKSRVIFDFFVYQTRTKLDHFSGDRTRIFGQHTYKSSDLAKDLRNLSLRFPGMTISLDSTMPLYMRRQLTSSEPGLYRLSKKSVSETSRQRLKDYGFDKVIDLSWTILGRKHSKSKALWSAPRIKIRETMKILLSVYNSHQM